MSDRIHGITILLENDMRDDDVEPIINAISMIKGVKQIVPKIVTGETELARLKAKGDLRHQLYEIAKNL